jgi:hypothetical protein
MIAQADAELADKHHEKKEDDEACPGEEQGAEQGRQMKGSHRARLAGMDLRARRAVGPLVHRCLRVRDLDLPA